MKPAGYLFFPDAPPLPINIWAEVKAALRPDSYLWIRGNSIEKASWYADDLTLALDKDVPCEYRALLLLLD